MNKITENSLQKQDKPVILALETSGRTGSAALASAEALIAEKQFSTPVKHSSEIFPAIQDLLKTAGLKPEDIEEVYISAGPGSFTGLRIAVTIAKIMNLANNKIKIAAVDTLDCVASNIIEAQRHKGAEAQSHKGTEAQRDKGIKRIASILDAKRGQFFIAVYQKKKDCAGKDDFADCWEKVVDDCLMTAKQFIERFGSGDDKVWLLGEGLVYYKKDFEAKGIDFVDERFWTPWASKVFILGRRLAKEGRFTEPLNLVPKYLLRPDIKIKKI